MEYRTDADPRISLRPGVAFPDWSAVRSERARAALRAIFELFDPTTRWQGYGEREDRVHVAVLEHYAELGHAPSIATLAEATATPTSEIRQHLLALEDRDMLVLDGQSGEITGAYPLTERETDHRVFLNGQRLHAMCAVDALGTGAMYGRDVTIESACRGCRRPIDIATGEKGTVLGSVTPAETLVHLGIRYQDQAATSLCTVIAFFCSPEHLEKWRAADADIKGYALSLEDGLQVAMAIFAPFLAQADVEG